MKQRTPIAVIAPHERVFSCLQTVGQVYSTTWNYLGVSFAWREVLGKQLPVCCFACSMTTTRSVLGVLKRLLAEVVQAFLFCSVFSLLKWEPSVKNQGSGNSRMGPFLSVLLLLVERNLRKLSNDFERFLPAIGYRRDPDIQRL
jgi:hypothetical protein